MYIQLFEDKKMDDKITAFSVQTFQSVSLSYGKVQSNFNGSNTFGTMKISSRQG